MTIELFRVDPYCVDFGAQIIDIGTDYVVLDQTYFFPKSDEQASDQGLVDTFDISGVTRVDSEVRHLVSQTTASNLETGDIVACRIDWERRYRTMRLHTAQHLVRLAVSETRDTDPLSCGAVSHEAALIQYSSIDLGPAELQAVQSRVETIIDQEHLTIHEVDRSLQGQRFWHIDGLAAFPCDGTHVRLTSEVGPIRIQHNRRLDDTIEFRVELASN